MSNTLSSDKQLPVLQRSRLLQSSDSTSKVRV